MACTTICTESRHDWRICILCIVCEARHKIKEDTYLLGPSRSAVSTSSATIDKKSSRCSVGTPRPDKYVILVTIQSGH